MGVSTLAAALPPPLRGRFGERGGRGRDGSLWLPLSLPLPRKGGNERVVPNLRANHSRRLSSESNLVLLCMGLFSIFLRRSS
ncbi:hypothetical protein V1278_001110 [Bradyrhizobium sp. AZCC 1577]